MKREYRKNDHGRVVHWFLFLLLLACVSVRGQDDTSPEPTPEPTPEPVTPPPTPEPVTPEPTPEPMTPPPTPEPTPEPTTGSAPQPTPGPMTTPEPTPASATPGPTNAPGTPMPTPVAPESPVPTTPAPTMVSTPLGTTVRPTPNPTPRPTTPFPTVDSQVNYLNAPKREWAVQLNDTGNTFDAEIGRGNAVTVSPDDGLIYVTLNDGRLEILSAADGSPRFSFMPERNPQGWQITCQSGVYFGEVDTLGKFIVYAITDKAPLGQDSQSRVVALAHGGHLRHLWTSPPIPGIIQGTPVITRRHLSGMYIFVTHNINTSSGTAPASGVFSVLEVAREGAVFFSQGSGDINPADIAPYGPMGVSHFPNLGKFDEGLTSNNDVVVWATSTADGFGTQGYTVAFQFPAFWFPSDGVGVLKTHKLASPRWTAAAAPALTQNGLGLFFGVLGSQLRGWVFNRQFDRPASWTRTLQTVSGAARTPIPNAPVLAFNDRRFYVSTAAKTFAGIDTLSGMELFQKPTSTPILTEARPSVDNRRVYVIESGAGTIFSYDQFTGFVYWSANCNSFQLGCSLSNVDAEFSMSSSSLVLFYGDKSGLVSAVRVGESRVPTVAPTNYPTIKATEPTTLSPNVVVTDSPTVSPSESPRPSGRLTLGPTGDPTVSPTRFPTSSPAPTRDFGIIGETMEPTGEDSASLHQAGIMTVSIMTAVAWFLML